MMDRLKWMMGALLAAGLVVGGCSAEVGNDGADGDAVSGDDATADTSTGGDTSPGDTSPGDTSTGTTSYKALLIFDKSEDPADNKTTGTCSKSPGSDIDAVGLWRKGTDGKVHLVGVGRVGSANYHKSSTSKCDNTKNDPTAVEGALNGKVFADKPDTGYISLNGGDIELQIGGCQTDNETIATCDGKGAVVEIMEGDELDIYEVDATYKPTGDGPQKDRAYAGCVCYADEYQVMLRKEPGVDAGSVYLGTTGPTTYKGTQSGDLSTPSAIKVQFAK